MPIYAASLATWQQKSRALRIFCQSYALRGQNIYMEKYIKYMAMEKIGWLMVVFCQKLSKL
jgi:hypothetical protein